MKKLALALACFASVAFMASCTKPVDKPEPSLAVMTGENYVYDGQTIDLNQDYMIGFRAASNSDTQKELASFSIVSKLFDMDDNEYYTEDSTYTISGTEYVYEEPLRFGTRELVAKATFTATIIDVDGKTTTTTINLNINQPAVELQAEEISWVKTGHNVQDLSAYGLEWKTTNYKDPFTHIFPAEGCMLFACSGYGDDFANINTDVDLANYFNNLLEMTVMPQTINTTEYNKVDCNASANYNDLLITKDAEGNFHAIRIVRAEITTPSAGTRITITGEAK